LGLRTRTTGGRAARQPFGFTKVSALGVEEQRVNVIIDITDPIELWRRLGHGYRVEANIVLWESADVLKVPLYVFSAARVRRGDPSRSERSEIAGHDRSPVFHRDSGV
jgi:hypothetical protein